MSSLGATSGQVYYHDWQLSAAYQPNYHIELDRKMHAKVKATEMITEIYVPRSALVDFMEEARLALREQKSNVIYGTVRLIEKDEESFLRWAGKLCVRDLQPARHSRLCRAASRQSRIPDVNRSRYKPQRQLLSDVSSLGDCAADRDLLSAISRFSNEKTRVRPKRSVSKRLVRPSQKGIELNIANAPMPCVDTRSNELGIV